MAQYKIGEIAKQANLSKVTLRYYEKINLLTPRNRSESGYRLYDEQDLQKLKFIRNAKSTGLTLNEINKLFSLQKSHESPQQVKALLDEKIASIDKKINDLQTVKQMLVKLNSTCSGAMDIQDCPILKKLSENP